MILFITLGGCYQENNTLLKDGQQKETAAHPLELETKELTAVYDKTYPGLNDSVQIPDGISVHVKISIPQVKNVENSVLAQQLNEYFLMKGNELLTKAVEYLGTSELEKNTEIVVDWGYEVTRNDGTWLSIRRQGYINAGGAYPTTAILGDTIYLNEENIEVISKGTFPREALDGYFDFNFFYLTEKSLIIFYQEDTLGPHAIGIPEFEIPLKNLKDIWAK
jgi:hypothetical protein